MLRLSNPPSGIDSVRYRTAIGVCLVLLIPGCTSQPVQEADGGVGKRIELGVQPFSTDSSTAAHWSATAFVESLSVKLRSAGITVVPTGTRSLRRGPSLTLGGAVTMRNSRLMITAEILRRGEQTPVWASTYWRDGSATSQAVDAVSVGVAEAIYGDVARRAMSSKEKTP
jgi:TolB-like protein